MKKLKRQPKLDLGESAGESKKMKTKAYWLVLLVGVGLIVGSLVMKKDGEGLNLSDLTGGDEEEEVTEVLDAENVELTTDNTNTAPVDTINGVLSVSDDLNKGTLKIVSNLGVVYLRTSRDFSKLLGAQVSAFINGSLENFELVDIQAMIQKDGYILPQ